MKIEILIFKTKMENINLEDYVIKDDFYNSIKDEISCSICSCIKVKPTMCTKCQNSFCESCIEQWKKKSPECPFKCTNPTYTFCRIINNLLCKLSFKCKNNCGENIPYDKLEAHYEYECNKIDFKQRNKILTEKYHTLESKYNILESKYNLLESKYNKLKNSFMNLLDLNLDSKILKEPDDLAFIKNSLSKYFNKNIKLKLLYRASRDGDTGLKFHEKCDNKEGGILVLYHTDENIIFGGFSNAKWISYSNPEKKSAGQNFSGNVNFLFQINSKKIYNLRIAPEEKINAIFCRSDCGPCFGSLGEDIWCRTNFLTKSGKLHKDKNKGRKCSFDTKNDYELNNGKPDFNLQELEAFLLI